MVDDGRWCFSPNSADSDHVELKVPKGKIDQDHAEPFLVGLQDKTASPLGLQLFIEDPALLRKFHSTGDRAAIITCWILDVQVRTPKNQVRTPVHQPNASEVLQNFEKIEVRWTELETNWSRSWKSWASNLLWPQGSQFPKHCSRKSFRPRRDGEGVASETSNTTRIDQASNGADSGWEIPSAQYWTSATACSQSVAIRIIITGAGVESVANAKILRPTTYVN